MTAQENVSAIARRHTGAHDLKALIDQQRGEIAKALPKHLDAERMIRIAWSTIRGNTKLLQCSPLSVLSGVMESAQLGLTLDGPLGHAYLVPYRVKGQYQAQFQIGYRGMLELAYRAGKIICRADVVRDGDLYEYVDGTEFRITHTPALTGRGAAVCAWGVAIHPDGRAQGRQMTYEEIEAIRGRSRAADNGPWKTDPAEMAKKTVLRNLLKIVPLNPEATSAIVEDEHRDLGVSMGPATDVEATVIEEDEDAGA